MDRVFIIRVLAGILAVLVLGIIVWRRRRQASQ
jgi:hypothetical protein